MAVYNALPYLPEAMDSILQQTFTDFEFLVLDDGSTDRSLEVIQDYADRYSCIRIIRNRSNCGLSYCGNRLLQEARGEYLALMDADDISEKERLCIQSRFLDKNPDIGIVGTAMTLFGGQKKVSRPLLRDLDIKSYLLLAPAISNPTVMMRTAIVRQNSLSYDVSSGYGTDYLFWVDACPFTKMANLSMPLLRYRVHGSQNSVILKKDRYITCARAMQKHLSRFNIKAEIDVIRRLLWQRDFPCVSIKEILQIRQLIHSVFSIKPFYGYEEGVASAVKKKMRRKYIRLWGRWIMGKVSSIVPR